MRVAIGLRNEHLVRPCPPPRPSPCERPVRWRPMSRRPRSRTAGLTPAVVLTAAIALLATASCSPGAPTPPPSEGPTPSPSSAPPSPSASPPDPLEVYATIEDQVAAIRELDPKATLTPTILDVAQLEKNIREEFDRDNPPEAVAEGERLLVALGLLQPDASLRDAYVELLGGQVIGYYSPEDDALFVVSRSGALGVTERA